MMTLEKLDNLVRIKQLKTEPPDQAEFDGFVRAAIHQLQDSQVDTLSEEGRFLLAYAAAHGLALAAMRWHGYRSDNRYLVFQSLQHTVQLTSTKWRVLDQCHKYHNLAEYEGSLEISPQLLVELIKITKELESLVKDLGPVT